MDFTSALHTCWPVSLILHGYILVQLPTIEDSLKRFIYFSLNQWFALYYCNLKKTVLPSLQLYSTSINTPTGHPAKNIWEKHHGQKPMNLIIPHQKHGSPWKLPGDYLFFLKGIWFGIHIKKAWSNKLKSYGMGSIKVVEPAGPTLWASCVLGEKERWDVHNISELGLWFLLVAYPSVFEAQNPPAPISNRAST